MVTEDPRHAKNLAAAAVQERERLWKLVRQAETISLPPEAVARAVLTKKRQLIKPGLSEG